MENTQSPVLDEPSPFITARAGADLLCLGEVTFRNLVKAGTLPAGFKVAPRKTLWNRADLIAFVRRPVVEASR